MKAAEAHESALTWAKLNGYDYREARAAIEAEEEAAAEARAQERRDEEEEESFPLAAYAPALHRSRLRHIPVGPTPYASTVKDAPAARAAVASRRNGKQREAQPFLGTTSLS